MATRGSCAGFLKCLELICLTTVVVVVAVESLATQSHLLLDSERSFYLQKLHETAWAEQVATAVEQCTPAVAAAVGHCCLALRIWLQLLRMVFYLICVLVERT